MIRAFWKEIVHIRFVVLRLLVRKIYFFKLFWSILCGEDLEVMKMEIQHDGGGIERGIEREQHMKIIDSSLRARER